MKKLFLVTITLFLSINVHSQMRRDRMGNPQVQREPTEQEIAKREREIEERKQEYITNFLSTLEADEFQQVIIRQHLNSFYDAKLALFKTPFERKFERQKAIEQLEKTHFEELKSLISESDMKKIQEMVKGEFDEKEVVKEKKKKKKKKRKKEKAGY